MAKRPSPRRSASISYTSHAETASVRPRERLRIAAARSGAPTRNAATRPRCVGLRCASLHGHARFRWSPPPRSHVGSQTARRRDNAPRPRPRARAWRASHVESMRSAGRAPDDAAASTDGAERAAPDHAARRRTSWKARRRVRRASACPVDLEALRKAPRAARGRSWLIAGTFATPTSPEKNTARRSPPSRDVRVVCPKDTAARPFSWATPRRRRRRVHSRPLHQRGDPRTRDANQCCEPRHPAFAPVLARGRSGASRSRARAHRRAPPQYQRRTRTRSAACFSRGVATFRPGSALGAALVRLEASRTTGVSRPGRCATARTRAGAGVGSPRPRRIAQARSPRDQGQHAARSRHRGSGVGRRSRHRPSRSSLRQVEQPEQR